MLKRTFLQTLAAGLAAHLLPHKGEEVVAADSETGGLDNPGVWVVNPAWVNALEGDSYILIPQYMRLT